MTQTAAETTPATEALVAELDRESYTTRRLLASAPEHRYGWRPHEKGRSMGELCLHIAAVTGAMPDILDGDTFDISGGPGDEEVPASADELLARHDEGVARARSWLAGIGAALDDEWRLVRGEEEVMTMRRADAIRTLLFNHLYHHRGQLSAYLRAAGERVPSVYGPSADENPFEG